ncbi:hypothetical protein [uncultured Photobacterium sp.]|uniref:hypothetical protein n=1 Tax=uncultured Photobacterium sp. TaxID=173973 RepID=UPI0026029E4A|nr:hypothetical protein [uncultured Photobacterium sp.]
MKTVSLSVNTNNFLAKLENIFTDRRKVFGELIQNARRAGSNKIEFSVMLNDLVVRDYGCGINDLSSVLTVAQSGWDKETIDAEDAFGFGFIITLYCCEAIEIRSKGKSIKASTASILAGEPIEIVEAEQCEGTEIILMGLKGLEQIKYDLNCIATAQEIEVWFNGEELERPLSNTSLLEKGYRECQFELGAVYINPKLTLSTAAYLQAHEMTCVSNMGFIRHYDRVNIVKLDSTKVKARMPDRDAILDREVVRNKVNTAVKKLVENEVMVQRAEMADDKAFVHKYEELLSVYLPDMLVNFDYLPPRFFFDTEEYPSPVTQHTGRSWVGEVLHRDEILSKKVFEDQCWDVEEPFTVPMYIREVGALELCRNLPENHWLNEHVQSLSDHDIEVVLNSPQPVQTINYTRLQLCESYTLSGPFGEFVIDGDAFFDGDRHIVPANERTGLVIQHSEYFVDDDTLNDHLLETREEWLENVLVQLRCKTKADLLCEVLKCAMNDDIRIKLEGHQITVSIIDGEIVCKDS